MVLHVCTHFSSLSSEEQFTRTEKVNIEKLHVALDWLHVCRQILINHTCEVYNFVYVTYDSFRQRYLTLFIT